eukprot:5727111-Amphidinium_carterae.1
MVYSSRLATCSTLAPQTGKAWSMAHSVKPFDSTLASYGACRAMVNFVSIEKRRRPTLFGREVTSSLKSTLGYH